MVFESELTAATSCQVSVSSSSSTLPTSSGVTESGVTVLSVFSNPALVTGVGGGSLSGMKVDAGADVSLVFVAGATPEDRQGGQVGEEKVISFRTLVISLHVLGTGSLSESGMHTMDEKLEQSKTK